MAFLDMFKKKQEEEVTEEDIKKVLKIVDNLLGKLPEKEIEKFAMSKNFKLYKKVLKKFAFEEHEKKLVKKVSRAALTKEQIEKIDSKVRESAKKHRKKRENIEREIKPGKKVEIVEVDDDGSFI